MCSGGHFVRDVREYWSFYHVVVRPVPVSAALARSHDGTAADAARCQRTQRAAGRRTRHRKHGRGGRISRSTATAARVASTRVAANVAMAAAAAATAVATVDAAGTSADASCVSPASKRAHVCSAAERIRRISADCIQHLPPCRILAILAATLARPATSCRTAPRLWTSASSASLPAR